MNFDKEEFRKMVGHRIKVRRVDLNMNQVALGDLLGVPQAQVSDWENARRALRIEQMAVIARELQTSIGYLVGEKGA